MKKIVSMLCLLLMSPLLMGAIGEPTEDLSEGVGIRLLDVPVDRQDDPRAQLYIVDHLIPGTQIERTILVTNGTDEPVAIQMKGVPARTDDGWVVENDAEGIPPDSLAAWITAEPASFTLAAQSVTEVEVTIRVPSGVPAGERYAAIVAEPPPVDAGGGVGSVGRVGIRVYLSVGGDEPVTDFVIDTLTASRTEDGLPSVEVGILNTGGRAIDVSGELELMSEDDLLSAGPFPTSLPRTLGPRSRGSVTVPLPESLDSGPWTVTATMRSGVIERVAEATITFPEPGQQADPVESDMIGGTDADGYDIGNQRRMLLPLAAILMLLAIASLWWMVMWKRREEDDDEDEPVAAGAASSAGRDEGR